MVYKVFVGHAYLLDINQCLNILLNEILHSIFYITSFKLDYINLSFLAVQYIPEQTDHQFLQPNHIYFPVQLKDKFTMETFKDIWLVAR